MTQERIVGLLRLHPFTECLTEPQLVVLADMAEYVRCKEDQPVFVSGERPQHFYLLVSGTAALELKTPVYAVCIQLLGSGEAFGWPSLVDQHYATFQVRARETCDVLRIRGDRLLAACEADNRLGACLFRGLASLIARRLRATESRFADFCGHIPSSASS